MTEIALHILDIVHNSIRANATRIQISISENAATDEYLISVDDNGIGIPPEILTNVTDPFTTSRKTRKVGMGLSLLKHGAEQTGGWLKISSEPGIGTRVSCCFGLRHLDRPPIGNIAGTIYQLISAFPKIQFIYTHSTSVDEYVFDTVEVAQALGDVPITLPEVRSYLLEMINENLDEIKIVR